MGFLAGIYCLGCEVRYVRTNNFTSETITLE